MADNRNHEENEEGTPYIGGDYDPSGVDPRPRSTYFRRGEAPERRSKEQILDDITHRLIFDETIRANNIQVGVNDVGEVTLDGMVESYVAWRTLEGLVERIPGVVKVRNRLRVRLYGASRS